MVLKYREARTCSRSRTALRLMGAKTIARASGGSLSACTLSVPAMYQKYALCRYNYTSRGVGKTRRLHVVRVHRDRD